MEIKIAGSMPMWLAQMLDEEYVIVLVGLTPKQIKKMPAGILGLV